MMSGEDKMTITLTVNEWNLILGIMQKQPYEVVALLIQQIGAQAQQQQNAPLGHVAANGALAPVPPAVEFDQRRD